VVSVAAGRSFAGAQAVVSAVASAAVTQHEEMAAEVVRDMGRRYRGANLLRQIDHAPADVSFAPRFAL